MLKPFALLAALTLAAPAALASHMGNYAYLPTEHDDQGRSVEPDFAATAVLGPFVVNAVVDQDLDGAAVADPGLPRPFPGLTEEVAPGCTDDAGRQPSGLCGLLTGPLAPSAWYGLVPRLDVGVMGMSGAAAPGAFTPTKSTAVRFLDARLGTHVLAYQSFYLELNRKLDDAAMWSMQPRPSPVAAGPSAVWAWYGQWQDKNGNGVIDNFYHSTAQPLPPASPDEEFIWFGNCEAYPGIPNPASVVAGFCAYDREKDEGGRTTMVAYLFPGNHHAFNGGFDIDPVLCALCSAPADLPGRQVVHFLGAMGVPVCAENNPAGGLNCGPLDPAALDGTDEAAYGDPLLGPQEGVAPDGWYDDYGGDPSLALRGWRLAPGWPMWLYDQSLVVRLIHLTGVGCAAAPSGAPDPASCRFADVDRYEAVHPDLETLVQAEVKPAARGAWLQVRDNWVGISGSLDGAAHHRLARPTLLTGPLDDAAYDPGLSREPNDPRDAYPAARHNVLGCLPGDALHHGWCNDYAAHQAAARPFADVWPLRVGWVLQPIGPGNCASCVSTVVGTIGYGGEGTHSLAPVRFPGDHRRTLGPGQYLWSGHVGAWKDAAQTWEETVFDPLQLATVTTRYHAAPDGWVGNIVNATGAFVHRGYAAERCTTDQGAGVWPYAWCHPYLDGALQNPQQLGAAGHREWQGHCDLYAHVVVAPADGRWDIPVLVRRDVFGFFNLVGFPGGLQVEDHTGSADPIVLRGECIGLPEQGGFRTGDLIILPIGNLGEDVTATMAADVLGERVTDVDAYGGWGLPR